MPHLDLRYAVTKPQRQGQTAAECSSCGLIAGARRLLKAAWPMCRIGAEFDVQMYTNDAKTLGMC